MIHALALLIDQVWFSLWKDFKLSNGFGLDQYSFFIFIDFRIIHTTGIITTGIEFREMLRVGVIWIRHLP